MAKIMNNNSLSKGDLINVNVIQMVALHVSNGRFRQNLEQNVTPMNTLFTKHLMTKDTVLMVVS